MDVKYIMVTIRRRRRRRPLMGRGMQMVRRPRRQRGGRMHYMRRRFQKGGGYKSWQDKMDDAVKVPLFALMSLTADMAHKRHKK